MNKFYNFIFCIASVLFTLTSCSRSIKIDITRHSSDLNNCENIFGPDSNTLRYENAILLQTGVIDTKDEKTPVSVAIIVIDKKEIILKLIYHNEVGNETNEIYEGEGYKINLSYKKEITEYNIPILKGKFLIANKDSKSEYDIVGSVCNL
jgi:hypothetical protein